MRFRFAAAVAIAAVAAVPANSTAAWRQVTSSGGSNIDQVGLWRAGDGVLHLAWPIRTGGNAFGLNHTVIRADGSLGATSRIVSGWAGVENPALVRDPGGMRVFFGGQHSTYTDDPNQELITGRSHDGGADWSLAPGSVVPKGAQAYGSPVSAAVIDVPNDTPLEAWASTLGVWLHSGFDPNTPSHNYQAPLGGNGYDAGIASAIDNTAVVAWYSNATGHLGVFAQHVGHDGSPVGPLMHMPGTANMHVGQLGRTPIVARAGGGFYVAFATGYPSLKRILIWRVGRTDAALMAKTRSGSSTATLAGAPDGRLWIVWKDELNGKPSVFARRSNKATTTFGAAVNAGRPTGASSLYRLDASSTADALDTFGSFSVGTAPGVATWYRRIFPGLTLTADKARITKGKATDVTFEVTDAGDAVSGARVSAAGQHGTTNGRGQVTLTIKRKKTAMARATAPKYTGTTLKLHVRK